MKLKKEKIETAPQQKATRTRKTTADKLAFKKEQLEKLEARHAALTERRANVRKEVKILERAVAKEAKTKA